MSQVEAYFTKDGYPKDKTIEDILRMMFESQDKDEDGYISFDEFQGPKHNHDEFWSIFLSPLGHNKSLRFLVSTRVPQTRHTSAFLVLKRCPIAAKIAGSIRIMLRYVLNNFFT